MQVLVCAQVLGGLAIGVGASVSLLLAKEILDGDGTFAGLAFASLTLRATVAAIPLSRLMARRGRRPGLVRGYLIASLGAAIAIASSVAESFPLLLLGMMMLEWGTCASLLARYAGADLAEPDHRARAISTVVWGTTIGAEATRKIKNLALDPHCSISVEWDRLDPVIEGTAVKVRDESTLKRVADEYDATYGWRVTMRDGAFHDTEGAPTAGPPPYDVYELVPTIAFGFGVDETFTPTRWQFRPARDDEFGARL